MRRDAIACESKVGYANGTKGWLIYRGYGIFDLAALGIAPELFTPVFAVGRVPGWTARVLEYLRSNRIFRPRALYIGPFGREYQPINRRGATSRARRTT